MLFSLTYITTYLAFVENTQWVSLISGITYAYFYSGLYHSKHIFLKDNFLYRNLWQALKVIYFTVYVSN